MTYSEAVDWLYGLQLHGIKLGLENMRRLCGDLGISLNGSEAPTFLHVAGTNGKGSVCAMLDAICREAGIRTGLYTSPHLITFRERICLNGSMIPEADVAAILTRIHDSVRHWDYSPTFFEAATALGLFWFQQQEAEVVVLETGLGGRLDATNVVTPAVSVLTSIGFDHQRYLGSTLAEITGEKCGIIKPGIPVASAPQAPAAAGVIQHRADQSGSRLEYPNARWDRSPIGLTGSHQQWNAALATLAIEVAGKQNPLARITPQHIEHGLAAVRWPGRFQRAKENLVLDGAHNPDAAETLTETWRATFGETKATLVLGLMRDKDIESIWKRLELIAGRVICVTVGNPRSCTATELVEIIARLSPRIPCRPSDSTASALIDAEAGPNPVLVCGSLFLVAEAMAVLGLAEDALERSVQ